MPHELQRLQARHQKILDLSLDGFSRTQIAELVGMSPTSVGLILRAPLFQEEYSRRKEAQDAQDGEDRSVHRIRARDTLESASQLAAQKHVELLDSQDESIQLRSAKEILDRAWGKESEGKPSITVSADQINLLIETAQQVQEPEKEVIAKIG